MRGAVWTTNEPIDVNVRNTVDVDVTRAVEVKTGLSAFKVQTGASALEVKTGLWPLSVKLER